MKGGREAEDERRQMMRQADRKDKRLETEGKHRADRTKEMRKRRKEERQQKAT
jgi:hypothetical protein